MAAKKADGEAAVLAKHGKVVCFWRAAKYRTFGLNDTADLTLEEGSPAPCQPAPGVPFDIATMMLQASITAATGAQIARSPPLGVITFSTSAS